MPVIINTNDKKSHIEIQGELTIFTALEVFEELKSPAQSGKEIELDLSQVSEMDSAGLQILLTVKSECALRNTTLSITAHSPAVSELLTLSDLVGFFGDPMVIESEIA